MFEPEDYEFDPYLYDERDDRFEDFTPLPYVDYFEEEEDYYDFPEGWEDEDDDFDMWLGGM